MTTFTGRIGQRVLLSYVDPFPGLRGDDKRCGPCPRCGGCGEFGPKVVYAGRCFQCHGSGRWNYNVSTHRKWARQAAYERDYSFELAEHDAAERAAHIEERRLADEWLEAEARFKEEERLKNLVQGYVGEIGDKVSGLDVTIKVAKYCAAQRYGWSASMFIIAETESGQVVKISGSAQSLFDLKRGDKATILTGKVKDHTEYAGQEQTVLSHVKVEIHEVEVDDAA